MRSLRIAARVVTLGALTAITPGCGYPNPAFLVKDSDPETESADAGTNISGATVTSESETTTPPTSTTTSTTGEMTTSNGPNVSGSETSTSSGEDPTTSELTTETTTGMPNVEWPPCDPMNAVAGPAAPAAADTFLLNDTGGQDCETAGLKGPCKDQNLGGVKFYHLFFQSSDNDNQNDDFASIFIARFDALPTLKHEGLTVPDSAKVGVRVTIRVAPPVMPLPWEPTTFNMFDLKTAKAWADDGTEQINLCASPSTSFRCLECDEPGACKAAWPGGFAYPLDENKNVGSLTLEAEPDAEQGADISFDFPVAELAWLTKAGFALIPDFELGKGRIGVQTSESGHGPTLQYLYCPPVYP